MHSYFRRRRPRLRVNIDQHYPPPPAKKNCLEGNIIPCTFKMMICTRCWNIKGKEIRKIARVLHFNQITKLLLYLTKFMRFYFKQNERFKFKKYDRARNRTWNLLIRSQTPYPRPRGPDRTTWMLLLFENHLSFKYFFKVFFSSCCETWRPVLLDGMVTRNSFVPSTYVYNGIT